MKHHILTGTPLINPVYPNYILVPGAQRSEKITNWVEGATWSTGLSNDSPAIYELSC